ncbi:MAG: carbohydrate ABC transporter permease [Eubacteriales bacterium]|nr:carbohydrate ABC transporter permease [Eubacteriales bacterium]
MLEKKKFSVYRIVAIALLFLISLTFIFPFYWIVTGAFKTAADIRSVKPIFWPSQFSMENFTKLFVNPAGRWLFNSVFMSLASMALVCITASMAGYVLAKKRFTGRAVLFTMFVASMALPKQVVMVPLVRVVANMGFHGTMWAVILPTVGWPFGIFLMKQFAEGIPGELMEAARIDGANEFKTFTDIVMPMLKPAFGALAIFTFINVWNDYFLQLVMLTGRNNFSIALGIATLQGEYSTDYGLIMAGAALGSVPIVAIFILFQNTFTQGIALGAVKG